MRKLVFLPLFFLATFALLLNAAFAQEKGILVKASVTGSVVTIGTKMDCQVMVEYGAPVVSVLEITPAEGAIDFSIEANGDLRETKGSEGRRALLKKFTVSPYLIGEAEIPSFQITYTDSLQPETPKTVFSEPIPITIKSVRKETDPDDIRPLKPIVDLRDLLKKILLYAGSILGILVVLIAGVRLFRDLLDNVLFQEKRELSPYELAFQKLKEIEKTKYSEGDIKLYIDQLSDVLRSFIGKTYTFNAIDLTTNELQDELRKINLQEATIAPLVKLLTECDFVKFAKYNPGIERFREVLQEAKQLLESIYQESRRQTPSVLDQEK